MDFQTDDGLVFREHLRRDRGFLWSRFRHKGTKIIASAGAAIERLRKLASGGGDGISGGYGEVRWELIEWEPTDFAGLSRCAIFGAAAGYAAQIAGGNPVLAFVRQEMIGNAK